MFKKLTLLILVVFSLDFYSQIVIKDEISLSDSSEVLENTDNSVTVTSPFYGRIYFRRDCMNNWTSTVKGEVVADGESKLYGNYNCDCEGGSSCLGCIGSTVHNFYNKPMGTEVEVNVQYCYNHQWVEVPLQFEYVGNNRYNLSGMNPISGTQWESMGYVKFIETTPLPCPNANGVYCSEHGLRVPNVKAKPVNWITGDLEKCDDYSGNIIRWAYTYLPDEWLEEFGVFACFDLSRQKWQFLTDNDNSLNINTGIKICSTNITYWLEMQLVDSLDDVNGTYPCDKLIQDLKRFKNYGEAKKGSYVFTKLIYQHELLHVKEFQQNISQKRYLKFDDKYKELVDGFKCEDFDDPEEASEEIKDIIEDEWIEDLRNDAWDDDPIILMQLLELTEEQKWVLDFMEKQEHKRMYDIIDEWIAKAEECLN